MSVSKVSSRLTEAVSPEIYNSILTPRLAGFESVFEPLGNINKAHVIMLKEQGLLSSEQSGVLARGILKMEAAGAGAVPLDPAREDAYFNYEAHLMADVGTDIGGRMHIGRSRNDIMATLDRLRARAVLFDVIDGLLKARTTALEQAERFADVVMPGYTHLQPAQPMTYGFYLAGVAQALERDSQRLIDTLSRMNVCPLGAAAFAGTTFAIDRKRTAELLGFDNYVDNALDAVASRDFVLEIISDMSLLAILWSRVAQDFYVWATHEFALVEFPDSVATTSSIMPQKKNPVVLEYLKGRCGHIVAAFVAASIGTKGTNFSHSGESSREAISGFWETADEVISCLALFDLVLRTATPLKDNAEHQAAQDFSTATALADLLVRDHDLPFRVAHHIVGAVVRQAMDLQVPANLIDVEMVERAAMEQIGKPLHVDADSVRACLNPIKNVAARCSAGGPSSEILRWHIRTAHDRLYGTRISLESWQEGIDRAQENLQATIQSLALQ